MVAYFTRTERLVNKYASGAVPELLPTSVNDLVEAVRVESEDLAAQFRTELHIRSGPDREMILPRELLEEALVELIGDAMRRTGPLIGWHRCRSPLDSTSAI